MKVINMIRLSLFVSSFGVLLALSPALAAPEDFVDTDGDSLDDNWELSYFFSLAEEDGSGDPDGDGLTNLEEQDLETDPTKEDTDGDGLEDKAEVDSAYELDPTLMDTDGDFLGDGEEVNVHGTDPTNHDSDADGLSDYIEIVKGFSPTIGDSDGGGVWDGEEVLVDKTNPLDEADDLMDSDNDGLTNWCENQLGTNPFAADTDGDWIADGLEDANGDCVWDEGGGETDPIGSDTDGDGLHDGWELMVYDTDPFAEDSDGDGLTDGDEHALKMGQYECLSPAEVDSDMDGLDDASEVGGDSLSDPCVPDSDGDGVYDVSEDFDGTDPSDPADALDDEDDDGLSDNFENNVTGTDPSDPDTDGDGLDDAEESIPLQDAFITDALDADSDDDGILDGNEGGQMVEGKLKLGTHPLKWDTEEDGLSDGMEKGLAEPELSDKDPEGDDTDLAVFAADTDPSTKTGPLDHDSDDDGLKDGEEDANQNGFKDADETDPNLFDTDGDDIDDGWETKYSSGDLCDSAAQGPLDPLDPADKLLDNDGDGLSNFKEYKLEKWGPSGVVKNDTNPCDEDSDDDGLLDGQEHYASYGAGGPFGKGSDPNDEDTDGDGLEDGEEDANQDGAWSPLQETNPLQYDTDGDNLGDGHEGSVGTDPTIPDTDGDGLNDGMEHNLLGTDPLDPDTDDDGLWDGLEVGLGEDLCPGSKTNPHKADTDGDGLMDGEEDASLDGCWNKNEGETNPLDPDTDGDKLGDGLESGVAGDTDPESTTDPLAKDSDDDGLWDSHEDKNKNGAQDGQETDPNDKDTDDGGVADGTEVLVDGTDPLDPLDDNTADPDGDTITNAEEKEIGTDPYNADSDGDTIPDNVEVGENHLNPIDTDDDGVIDAMDTDSDNDGILDSIEAGDADLETAPVNSDDDELPDYRDPDSDNDTIPDAVEHSAHADADGVPDTDADGDGTPNYLDLDSDDAQGPDEQEGVGDDDGDGYANFVDPVDDEPENLDSDGDGLKNHEEEQLGTDPNNPDTDGDELNDKVEVEGPTLPLDADTDDDGLADGLDGLEDGDGDWLVHALDPDSDDDGIFDGAERGVGQPLEDFSYKSTAGTTYEIKGTDLAAGNFEPDQDPSTLTDHTLADTDGDGADDGAEDPNHNGKLDVAESDPSDPEDVPDIVDDDGDGLTNQEEYLLGIIQADGDLDDDGIADGVEHNWRCDTDRDGLPNFLDPDSDDDGLADGTEEGLAAPSDSTWTDIRYRNFIADSDPETTTASLLWDSDGDLARDGVEDWDHDGGLDEGESDPNDAMDNIAPELDDTDGDGLPDVEEPAVFTDPADYDSDDDGLADGDEPTFAYDTDLDGLNSANDPDSDNDGLADGTEAGVAEPMVQGPGGTDADAGNFVADADPSSTTPVLVDDADRGGVKDGSEDANKNGAVDVDESDPLSPADDYTVCVDTDDDGLCNAEEILFGTTTDDADSDDDGVLDGDEHNWAFDSDGDGVLNVLDYDSDSDLLVDGLELCVADPWSDTDEEAGHFVLDADPETCTFMVVPDSDHGGIADGTEDINHDGMVDAGETDPNDPADDGGETDDDPDGDTLPTELELEIGTDPYNKDSDGDYIPDNVEVGDDHQNPLDTDGDGEIDALDLDSDDDTIADEDEAGDDDLATPPVDTDGDQLPDYRDDDSDGDSILDLDEAGDDSVDSAPVDTDEDGDPDFVDLDADDDTIPDADEAGDEDLLTIPIDSDEDGLADYVDPDSDDDTILDADEAGDVDPATPPVDSDEDGTPDYLDLDSDDEGLDDQDEAQKYQTDPTLADTDGGGADDHLEVMVHETDPLDPADDFRGWLEPGAHIQGGPTCGTAGNAGGLWPGLALLGLLILTLGVLARRRSANLVALLFFVVAAATVKPAAAAEDPTARNTSIDGNYFRLDPDGSAFFYLLSDQVPAHMEYRASLSFHYVDSPLTVVKSGKVLRELIASRWEAQAAAVLGLWGFLEVGLHAPLVLYQSAEYPGLKLGSVDAFGLGNVMAFAKVQILSSSKPGGAGLAFYLPAYLPTGNSKAYMGFDGFGTSPTLVFTKRTGSVVYNLNAGYLLQPETAIFNITDDDKYFGGMGLGYSPKDALIEVGLEVLAFTPAADAFADSSELQAEADTGVKVHIGDLVFTVGGGTGLAPGFMTPDYRLFTKVEYAARPNPDRDGDGILNEVDKCPDRAEDKDGYKDEDGCPDPDNDKDKIPDKRDKCPDDPEDFDKFEDEDGCPDLDNDKDGIPDERDKCPDVPEDIDEFEDADGCPDPDNDKDGIPDVDDKCPNERETFNDFEDEDGCPDKKLAEFKPESKKIEIMEKIHFSFMSSKIKADSYPLLNQIVKILKDNPHVLKIQVEGHTDKTGSAAFNMGLSRSRAKAVVDYLIKEGIAKKRLKAVGYGHSRRIDYRSGPEANFNNRRVEFNIIKYAEPEKPAVP